MNEGGTYFISTDTWHQHDDGRTVTVEGSPEKIKAYLEKAGNHRIEVKDVESGKFKATGSTDEVVNWWAACRGYRRTTVMDLQRITEADIAAENCRRKPKEPDAAPAPAPAPQVAPAAMALDFWASRKTHPTRKEPT